MLNNGQKELKGNYTAMVQKRFRKFTPCQCLLAAHNNIKNSFNSLAYIIVACN